MLLAVDIGNTNVTFGVFDGEILRGTWRMRTDTTRTGDEYGALIGSMLLHGGFEPGEIGSILIGSVVPPMTRLFRELCPAYFACPPQFVTGAMDTGVTLDVDRPHEVGPDRIMNAAGAHALYGAPAVVVDFGTATTFDVILEGGVFAGGVFLPGIDVSMEALFQRAALLSAVELRRPARIIGRNSIECLQSGFYYGFLGQMERVLEGIIGEMATRPRVIATGGLAGLIAHDSPLVDVVDPHLALKGLEVIHRRLDRRSHSREDGG